MRYIYLPTLHPDDTFCKGVYELLKATEAEFVPPLHTRSSTTQKDLSTTQFSREGNLRSYFDAMLSQQFIIAADGDEVVGFLSFRKGEDENYISTIAVSPALRKQGIGRKMYESLLNTIGESATYTTRTWETNEYHQRILKRLGFRLMENKDDGRTDIFGRPVPSMYYIKDGHI